MVDGNLLGSVGFDKLGIVIAMHVNAVLNILYLISRRHKIRIRTDDCSAREHYRSATAGSPLVMSRTSGNEVFYRDIFLTVIDR